MSTLKSFTSHEDYQKDKSSENVGLITPFTTPLFRKVDFIFDDFQYPPKKKINFFVDFFQGENTYRQQNGQIARNVLRRDYQKFLYQNNLPRDFDQHELEMFAKNYIGPVEQAAIDARAKLAQSKPKIKKYAPKDWSFMDL